MPGRPTRHAGRGFAHGLSPVSPVPTEASLSPGSTHSSPSLSASFWCKLLTAFLVSTIPLFGSPIVLANARELPNRHGGLAKVSIGWIGVWIAAILAVVSVVVLSFTKFPSRTSQGLLWDQGGLTGIAAPVTLVSIWVVGCILAWGTLYLGSIHRPLPEGDLEMFPPPRRVSPRRTTGRGSVPRRFSTTSSMTAPPPYDRDPLPEYSETENSSGFSSNEDPDPHHASSFHGGRQSRTATAGVSRRFSSSDGELSDEAHRQQLLEPRPRRPTSLTHPASAVARTSYHQSV